MKTYYVVETISKFKHKYLMCTDKPETLSDICLDESREFSQEFLGESYSFATMVTKEEYIKMFDTDNDYLTEWSEEKKMEFVNDCDSKI